MPTRLLNEVEIGALKAAAEIVLNAPNADVENGGIHLPAETRSVLQQALVSLDTHPELGIPDLVLLGEIIGRNDCDRDRRVFLESITTLFGFESPEDRE